METTKVVASARIANTTRKELTVTSVDRPIIARTDVTGTKLKCVNVSYRLWFWFRNSRLIDLLFSSMRL